MQMATLHTVDEVTSVAPRMVLRIWLLLGPSPHSQPAMVSELTLLNREGSAGSNDVPEGRAGVCLGGAGSEKVSEKGSGGDSEFSGNSRDRSPLKN